MDDLDINHRQHQILSLLKQGEFYSLPQLVQALDNKFSESTISRDLDELAELGVIGRQGQSRSTKYFAVSKLDLKNSKPDTVSNWFKDKSHIAAGKLEDEDPLVQLTVQNPIAYIKKWLKELLKNEGLKFKLAFEIKPLTVLGIVLILAVAGLGLKTLSLVFKYTPLYPYVRQVLSEPDNSRQSAFAGRLFSNQTNLFLIRGESEAILIQSERNLESFAGNRVIVSGRYNPEFNTLQLETIELE